MTGTVTANLERTERSGEGIRVQFDRAGNVWVAEIGHVRMYLENENGEKNAAQAVMAEQVCESLSTIQAKASAYLDLFVDRAKACGNSDEPWWLDEIIFRGPDPHGQVTYSLFFDLQGDDGGLWIVDVLPKYGEHRPIRFERRQG